MSDPAPPDPPPLPKIPDPYTIPLNVIHRWMELRDDQYLTLYFGRRDFDNLFFAFDRSLRGQSSLQRCLVLFSQGKIDEANAAMRDSEIMVAESQNYFRQFYTAVMTSAKPIEKDG